MPDVTTHRRNSQQKVEVEVEDLNPKGRAGGAVTS